MVKAVTKGTGIPALGLKEKAGIIRLWKLAKDYLGTNKKNCLPDPYHKSVFGIINIWVQFLSKHELKIENTLAKITTR